MKTLQALHGKTLQEVADAALEVLEVAYEIHKEGRTFEFVKHAFGFVYSEDAEQPLNLRLEVSLTSSAYVDMLWLEIKLTHASGKAAMSGELHDAVSRRVVDHLSAEADDCWLVSGTAHQAELSVGINVQFKL